MCCYQWFVWVMGVRSNGKGLIGDGSGEDGNGDINRNGVDGQCARQQGGGGCCMRIEGRGMRKENIDSNCNGGGWSTQW